MLRFEILNIKKLLLISFLFFPHSLKASSDEEEKYKYLDLFGQVFDRVRSSYVEEVTDQELIEKDSEGSLNFKPQPGRISDCDFPDQKNIQVISTAGAGKEVSPYYDSLLAQVIVHSDTRENAIVELIDYLERVRLTGITTNIPLLKLVLKDKVFRDGNRQEGSQ